MKRRVFFVLFLSTLSFIIGGCGGSDDNKTTLSGVYKGTMDFEGRHFNKGAYIYDTFEMEAELYEADSNVAGRWTLYSNGLAVTYGDFVSTVLEGTTMTGVMDDYGRRFNSPMQFSATVSGDSISGEGSVEWCGDWQTRFTISSVNGASEEN